MDEKFDTVKTIGTVLLSAIRQTPGLQSDGLVQVFSSLTIFLLVMRSLCQMAETPFYRNTVFQSSGAQLHTAELV